MPLRSAGNFEPFLLLARAAFASGERARESCAYTGSGGRTDEEDPIEVGQKVTSAAERTHIFRSSQ